ASSPPSRVPSAIVAAPKKFPTRSPAFSARTTPSALPTTRSSISSPRNPPKPYAPSSPAAPPPSPSAISPPPKSSTPWRTDDPLRTLCALGFSFFCSGRLPRRAPLAFSCGIHPLTRPSFVIPTEGPRPVRPAAEGSRHHRPYPLYIVIPSGATRSFLPRRFVARRVAQSRNPSSVFLCALGFSFWRHPNLRT